MLNQEDANQHTNKRILVLGSAPHTQMVNAYTWTDLPRDLNVADYDVVILNLEPLDDTKLASSITPGMLPLREEFARLLFSDESELIIIGYPPIKIGSKLSNDITDRWFPIFPTFLYGLGETIRKIESEFTYYFKYVSKWSYFAILPHHMLQYHNIPGYLNLLDSSVFPQTDKIGMTMTPIAQTRSHEPIAFELRFQIVRETLKNNMNTVIVKESGKVIWLPGATKTSNYNAVNLILKERYGVQFEQALPDWIAAYKLPEQIPIEEEISRHEKEIQRLENELTKAQQHLQHTSRFRKLLYEQGVEGLEPVVRDALRELGAIVCDPPLKENREDGRIRTPVGQIGMLEIKGRTKSLNLDDVRQLDQWDRDALFKEKLESKGILIANMYCGQPPEHRDNPFPDNCIDGAEIGNLCLMTTTQLFHALCSYQRNELDVAEFWNTVFATNGKCSLPELELLDSEQSSTGSSGND